MGDRPTFRERCQLCRIKLTAANDDRATGFCEDCKKRPEASRPAGPQILPHVGQVVDEGAEHVGDVAPARRRRRNQPDQPDQIRPELVTLLNLVHRHHPPVPRWDQVAEAWDEVADAIRACRADIRLTELPAPYRSKPLTRVAPWLAVAEFRDVVGRMAGRLRQEAVPLHRGQAWKELSRRAEKRAARPGRPDQIYEAMGRLAKEDPALATGLTEEIGVDPQTTQDPIRDARTTLLHRAERLERASRDRPRAAPLSVTFVYTEIYPEVARILRELARVSDDGLRRLRRCEVPACPEPYFQDRASSPHGRYCTKHRTRSYHSADRKRLARARPPRLR